MSIEQSLERIAAAIEKLLGVDPSLLKGSPAQTMTAGEVLKRQTEKFGAPLETPVTIQAAAESSAEVPAKSDREILMAQLDELKLPYPAKASTKRLKEILATHGPKPAIPAAPSPEQKQSTMFDTDVVKAAEAHTPKLYSVDEARDILKRFAAKFGSDKAVKILTDFKAANVTAIEQAGLTQEFVEEVLKQEKSNERK